MKEAPVGAAGYTLNEAGDSRMSAIYAGDSWQVSPQIRLDYGARYDFFNLDYTLDGGGTFPDGMYRSYCSSGWTRLGCNRRY